MTIRTHVDPGPNGRFFQLAAGAAGRVQSAKLFDVLLRVFDVFLRGSLVIELSVTCYPIVILVFGRKTRCNPLWEQGLRADHRIPKLDVEGSNPFARCCNSCNDKRLRVDQNPSGRQPKVVTTTFSRFHRAPTAFLARIRSKPSRGS